MKFSLKIVQPVVIGLVILGLVVLALSGYLTPVIRAASTPIVFVQSWLASRYFAIQSILNTPEDVAILRQRNRELELQISSLQAEIIELKQQVSETRILEALVGFARENNPENRYLASKVIGKDTSPFMQYIIIDSGSDKGLRRGMPVVTFQGLVGRVAAVLPNAARIQLITDTASALNVKIEPSGAPGVLQGQVTGNIVVDLIPKTSSINPGDLVLTSGLGGNYPSDLIAGQVTTVRSRENDLFQRATVQSAVDFDNLDIVLVITNFQPVDISPLVPTPSAP